MKDDSKDFSSDAIVSGVTSVQKFNYINFFQKLTDPFVKFLKQIFECLTQNNYFFNKNVKEKIYSESTLTHLFKKLQKVVN